jgi:hypothetical protein
VVFFPEEVELLVSLFLPVLLLAHQGPELDILEVIIAVLHVLVTVLIVRVALADEVISDTWVVAGEDAALVFDEREVVTDSVDFSPLAVVVRVVGVLFGVVQVPELVEVLVLLVDILLPPHLLAHLAPEHEVSEVVIAIGDLSVDISGPADEELGLAWAVADLDVALLLLRKHLEIPAVDVEHLPVAVLNVTVVAVVDFPEGVQIEEFSVLLTEPPLLLSHEHPELGDLEVGSAAVMLHLAVVVHLGDVAEELVGDAWRVREHNLAGVLLAELEVLARNFHILPLASLVVLPGVVGEAVLLFPVDVEVPVGLRLSRGPEGLFSELLPESVGLEVGNAVVVRTVGIHNVAHKGEVFLSQARVVLNVDIALVLAKHSELPAAGVQVLGVANVGVAVVVGVPVPEEVLVLLVVLPELLLSHDAPEGGVREVCGAGVTVLLAREVVVSGYPALEVIVTLLLAAVVGGRDGALAFDRKEGKFGAAGFHELWAFPILILETSSGTSCGATGGVEVVLGVYTRKSEC